MESGFNQGRLSRSNLGAIADNQGKLYGRARSRPLSLPPHGPKTKFLSSIIGHLRENCCFTRKLFSELNFYF